jgi:hypothetical protein
MADVTVTAGDVRLISGPVRRFKAGGTGSLGDFVYVADDGDVEQTDADAAASAQSTGVVISAGQEGATTFAAGDPLDVALPGAIVTGFSGLTPGAPVYASVTPGAGADAIPAAAGDYIWVSGRAISATELLVESWTYDVEATT